MRTEFATAGMEPALREIWRRSFDDTEEYIDFFFKNRFRPERAAVCLDGDAPVGVIHLLPAELCGGRALYGYAVAVLPEYRGRGAARLLHEAVFSETKLPYIVRPATPELFSFYEKLGLERAFFYRDETFEARPGPLPEPRELSPARFKTLRDEAFGGGALVRWDTDAISYAVRENALCGGFCLELAGGAVFGAAGAGALFVRETTLPRGALAELMPPLAARFGCETAVVRLPALSGECNGMVIGAKPGLRGYLGLALD